jgi:hypothetical protein
VWGGQASGGGQYGGLTGPVPDGNRARVKWSWAVLPANAFTIPGGTESYITRMLIRQARALACTGCNTPVCAVYNEEALSRLDGTSYKVTNFDYLTFNDATGASGCPGATPAAKKTWGPVKALYR